MLKPPHVDRSSLVVVAVAPLPAHVALTVSGSGICPPGGGPPPGLPEATPASATGKPGHRVLGSVMVTFTLALCSPLPTTKAESGMMKQSEPNVSPLNWTISMVACCMTELPPEFWVGRNTKSLRPTLSWTKVGLVRSGNHKPFASANLVEKWPGPRKPAANAALLVIAHTITAPIAVTNNLCARVI